MDLSFEQLKSMVVFATIVEQGSFSQASKVLAISRASVSYHVKKLEEQLGVKLFYRSTRSISMTDAGNKYYQRSSAVVEQAKQAQLEMQSFKLEPEGKLKITCPEGVGAALIAPIVSDFRKQFAKIEIELILTDRIVNLISEGVDVGIRGAATPMSDSDLQSIKLPSHNMCLCASPDYIAKHNRPYHPNDLDKHTWVIYSVSSPSIQLSQGNKSHTIDMQGNLVTNHAFTRTLFVIEGQGLGKLPMYMASEYLENGTLERVLSDYAIPQVEMYAVFPSGAANQKKLRLFLNFLKERLEQQRDQGTL